MKAKEYEQIAVDLGMMILEDKRFRVFTEESFKEFREQICKEQREICLNNMLDEDGHVRTDRPKFLVINAPIPESL